MDLSGLKLLTNLDEEKDENNRLVLESDKEFCLKFETNATDKGDFSAQVLGPNGRLQVSIKHDDTIIVISFTPHHEGDHYIHLFWRGSSLDISPLLGHCQGSVLGIDASKVVLQGRGYYEGRATVPAEFIIDGRKGGDDRSILPIYGTLTGTTTPGQSGLGSGGGGRVTLHFPKIQSWSHTTGYSLVSYSGHWIILA